MVLIATYGLVWSSVLLLPGAWLSRFFYDRSQPQVKTTIIITRGTTFTAAAQQVEKTGVARAWTLRFLERLHRRNGEISAGEFIFVPHLSAAQVYDELKSTALPVAHWMTIPEGFTAAQIGERLQVEGFSHARDFGSYAAHHGIFIGGVKTRSLEGYLFPSTYLISNDADSQAIAAMMVAEFRRQIPYNAQALAAKLHEDDSRYRDGRIAHRAGSEAGR